MMMVNLLMVTILHLLILRTWMNHSHPKRTSILSLMIADLLNQALTLLNRIQFIHDVDAEASSSSEALPEHDPLPTWEEVFGETDAPQTMKALVDSFLPRPRPQTEAAQWSPPLQHQDQPLEDTPPKYDPSTSPVHVSPPYHKPPPRTPRSCLARSPSHSDTESPRATYLDGRLQLRQVQFDDEELERHVHYRNPIQDTYLIPKDQMKTGRGKRPGSPMDLEGDDPHADPNAYQCELDRFAAEAEQQLQLELEQEELSEEAFEHPFGRAPQPGNRWVPPQDMTEPILPEYPDQFDQMPLRPPTRGG